MPENVAGKLQTISPPDAGVAEFSGFAAQGMGFKPAEHSEAEGANRRHGVDGESATPQANA
ncbi:hypothetical protein [Azospirillum sp. TSO22-1]|uniref:hypothetical protein n=1 Tax=Azospirillum sp. TSO22-1 TaxID=716789 RepID=UPI0011B5D4D1|nr:hypothetical protein [Azospirillum sp. TSO22-1]